MSGPYTAVEAVNAKVRTLSTEKKVGWFTRWFDRKCREAWTRANQEEVAGTSGLRLVATHDHSIDAEGMTIRLFNATGGTIVEFRRYDRVKDRSDNKMYVIPAGEEFGEKFAKIVSMEMMR